MKWSKLVYMPNKVKGWLVVVVYRIIKIQNRNLSLYPLPLYSCLALMEAVN